MSGKTFRELFAEAERDPAYWTERAILRVTEEITLAMARSEVTRSELARRLSVSPAYVTKILRGDANFTLESLARIAQVLDGEFRFHLAPKNARTQWTDVLRVAWTEEIDWSVTAARLRARTVEHWRKPLEVTLPDRAAEAEEIREVTDVAAAAAA